MSSTSETPGGVDPFELDDPLDAVAPAPQAAAAAGSEGDAQAPSEVADPNMPPDDDFDALGFDTGFGLDSSFGLEPAVALGIGDDDETPPGGIYMGEDVQVLDATAIRQALAEADGEDLGETELPDLGPLQHGLLGIDLGASVAVIARFDPKSGRHEIVSNEDDELITPGQMFIDEDGEQLVGREARLVAASAPQRAVVDLKRVITDPDYAFSPDGQESIPAERVLSMFLERLLEGVREQGHDVSHVALAAPAWFDGDARVRMARAIAETDVELVGIADECLAAAVPYSLRLPDLNPRTALVYDLGHAALGVGVVRCASGDIQVLAKAADQELGGSAWTDLLAREAARKFQDVHGIDVLSDPAGQIDLALRAEDAKQALSERAQCVLVVSAQGKQLKVRFTRTGFERAANKLIKRSLALAEQVRDEAGIDSWDQVDALILTGGGCRTPLVQRAVRQAVGKKAERGMGTDVAVAVGALYWGIGERHRQTVDE